TYLLHVFPLHARFESSPAEQIELPSSRHLAFSVNVDLPRLEQQIFYVIVTLISGWSSSLGQLPAWFATQA
ncbi:hypothetical protein HAX54_022927, partial [Datura stramonium]|nr:hypothetical protein [Datura stramonium]